MVSESRDIHELSLSEWGQVDGSSVGLIVVATVLCAHPYGLGIDIREIGAFGHVNSPRVSDDGYSLDIGRALVGKVVAVRVLAADRDQQATLTLRASDLDVVAADGDSEGPFGVGE